MRAKLANLYHCAVLFLSRPSSTCVGTITHNMSFIYALLIATRKCQLAQTVAMQCIGVAIRKLYW